jgi:hypothetical protein
VILLGERVAHPLTGRIERPEATSLADGNVASSELPNLAVDMVEIVLHGTLSTLGAAAAVGLLGTATGVAAGAATFCVVAGTMGLAGAIAGGTTVIVVYLVGSAQQRQEIADVIRQVSALTSPSGLVTAVAVGIEGGSWSQMSRAAETAALAEAALMWRQSLSGDRVPRILAETVSFGSDVNDYVSERMNEWVDPNPAKSRSDSESGDKGDTRDEGWPVLSDDWRKEPEPVETIYLRAGENELVPVTSYGDAWDYDTGVEDAGLMIGQP